MKIKKFQEYNMIDSISMDFISNMDKYIISESIDDTSNFKDYLNKIQKDLGINLAFIGAYGCGIVAFTPIVNSIMTNSSLGNFTIENIYLLIITALSIVYMEEKNKKSDINFKKNLKSLLEELKMTGIGNNIVKKTIIMIKYIKKIFNTIGKYLKKMVNGVVDMFVYTSLLIPIVNGVLYVINKNSLNFDNIIPNLKSIIAGVSVIVLKNGISYLIDKIKKSNKSGEKDLFYDIENPIIKKVSDFEISKEGKYKNSEIINEEPKY